MEEEPLGSECRCPFTASGPGAVRRRTLARTVAVWRRRPPTKVAELTETIAEMGKVLDRRLTAVAEQLDDISAQQTQIPGQFDNLTG